MSAISGPWVAETSVTRCEPDNGLAVIAVVPEVQRNGHDTPTRGMVAWVHSGIGACQTDEEAIDTARLIAAAPDLYDALAQIAWWMKDQDKAPELLAEAEKALAKARGES